MDKKETKNIPVEEFDDLGGGIKIPRKYFCDRCGNDLLKGKNYFNFPFIKTHIVLCHICLAGFMYGFYRDVCIELKQLKNE